jgi:predicted RNA-binding protein with PUA-like domain
MDGRRDGALGGTHYGARNLRLLERGDFFRSQLQGQYCDGVVEVVRFRHPDDGRYNHQLAQDAEFSVDNP